ncbi:MAG: hypothetical protein V7K92_21270 [Nostoc sp.]|uniref:hypothetical protein n=1 Tax=Nostoc sp. TaxID=1180 RepID=UPI002FF415D6
MRAKDPFKTSSKLQLNWQQRTQRPLPDSIKFALGSFEQIWIADGSTLEALFRKLKGMHNKHQITEGRNE